MNDSKHDVPEVEATQEKSELEHTIGSLLQKARKEKGLSEDDVAEALNLRVSLIKDFEADEFSNTASTTYAKGYIKNYARLVTADPILIQQCMKAQLSVDNSPTMQSFSRQTTRDAVNNRLTWITYLIVIVLVGMFVFWWAQKASFFSELTDLSKPSQEEQQRLPSDTTPVSNEPAVSQEAQLGTLPATSLILTEQRQIDQNLETGEPNLNSNNQLPTQTNRAGEEKANVEDKVIAELTSNSNDTPPLISTLLTEINLQLTENCWIKIEDATGKVLILGEKKAGYDKTVSGQPPFKAIFGAPQAVKLSLDNENIDLSYLPNSRVARITLPLEE